MSRDLQLDLMRQFQRGRSVAWLARTYALTRDEIEAALRTIHGLLGRV